MTGDVDRGTTEFDDLEWRLSASLHRAAHRADDQQFLGAIVSSMAAARQPAVPERTDGVNRSRGRVDRPVLVAVAAMVVTILSFWLVPHQVDPSGSAVATPAWTATVTVVIGDGVHGVPPAGRTFEVAATTKVQLVVHPTPGFLDRGKTYLQRRTASGWIRIGPHNTDASGTVRYVVRAPLGVEVSYRVEIRAAAGLVEGHSPAVTLRGS